MRLEVGDAIVLSAGTGHRRATAPAPDQDPVGGEGVAGWR